MKIGILTFYRVANFGANLQALSTYKYLINNGHTPIMINYYDKVWYANFDKNTQSDLQAQEHLRFVTDYLPNQTDLCFNVEDINAEIKRHNIEAVIVGSDAVVQHHPLITRLSRGRRKPIYIASVSSDRYFPNPLWGVGLTPEIKMALMSGSSQNSKYNLFTPGTKKSMRHALERFGYLSVRDNWTLKMFQDGLKVPEVHLTPDPVFAFNYNVGDMVPSKTTLQTKFNLPDKYVLVSLRGQSISYTELEALSKEFRKHNYECVALPMPEGVTFKHPFKYEIPVPLSPIDWYALIKNADGYVGSNMHPIVVSLHNSVPCYSVDNWGTRNWRGKATDNGSSKVEDIMKICGVGTNRVAINLVDCHIDAERVVDAIISFPVDRVRKEASILYDNYKTMMQQILESFTM